MKKVLIYILATTLFLSILIGISLPVFAQSDATKSLHVIGTNTEQTGYEKSEGHPKCSLRKGAQSICSVFMYTSDYLTYITASIAVLYLIISFVKLIYAGDKVEEAISKEKMNIKWILMGLILMVLADNIILDIFFGRETGGPTQPGQAWSSIYTVEVAGKALIKEIVGLYNAIELYLVYIGILVVVISGVRMIVNSNKDEEVKLAIKHIIYVAVGLVIIGLSEGIVYFVYPSKDETMNLRAGLEILSNITGFIAGFTAFLSLPALIYAGYLYVMYLGQDDMVEKAKKIIKSVIIGLIITSSAYGIVYTAMTLQKNPKEINTSTFKN